jgi:hypothetical protein
VSGHWREEKRDEERERLCRKDVKRGKEFGRKCLKESDFDQDTKGKKKINLSFLIA